MEFLHQRVFGNIKYYAGENLRSLRYCFCRSVFLASGFSNEDTACTTAGNFLSKLVFDFDAEGTSLAILGLESASLVLCVDENKVYLKRSIRKMWIEG